MNRHSYEVSWTNGPPRKESRSMYQIVRSPQEGFLEVVSLSTDITGVFTHWLEGRTQPCTAPNGCLCQSSALSSRWKGYIAAALATNAKVVLVEMSAEAAGLIVPATRHLEAGGLRGHRIRLSRDRRRKGGAIVARITSVERYPDRAMPPDLDVRAELMRIWASPGRR